MHTWAFKEPEKLYQISKKSKQSSGKQMSSKIDMNISYFQFPILEESRSITSFITPTGLKCFKPTTMGINSAGEKVDTILRDIPGVASIHDHITVVGNQEFHGKALRPLFARFSELGLTINQSKCKFNEKEITFWGMRFNTNGITPNPIRPKKTRRESKE